jgi:hypothetical protein
MAQQMSFAMATYTADRYVCARCWHRLLVTHRDHKDWVECSNPRCEGEGYVTKGYASRRLDRSNQDYEDARRNLNFILPAKPRRTEQAILNDLYGG